MIYKQYTPNFNNIFIKLMKTICNNQINNKDTPPIYQSIGWINTKYI